MAYRDREGWTDRASRVDQGLGYISVEEAAHLIRSLLNDLGRLEELSARARGWQTASATRGSRRGMRQLRSCQDLRLRVRSLAVLTVN